MCHLKTDVLLLYRQGEKDGKLTQLTPGTNFQLPSIPVALCWQLGILLYDSLLNARRSSSGTALKNI